MSSIHGHAVLELMLEHPEGLTRSELEQAVSLRFGADARFHTCSREDMTTAELVDFLDERGKFETAAGRLATRRDRICNH